MLSLWWRVAYWYGFLAQFTLLPFHQEYADSGHFTWADRASASLRNNLIFYAVLAVRLLPFLVQHACDAWSLGKVPQLACRTLGAHSPTVH